MFLLTCFVHLCPPESPSHVTRHLHAAAPVGGLAGHFCPPPGVANINIHANINTHTRLTAAQSLDLSFAALLFICLHAAHLTLTRHPPLVTRVCMSLLVCACRSLSAVVDSAQTNVLLCLFLSTQLSRAHLTCRCRLCVPRLAPAKYFIDFIGFVRAIC